MSIVRDYDFKRRLPVYSMLRIYPILYDTKDRIRFVNIFRTLIKNKDMDESFMYDEYMVQENDWFDLIAYKHYGTSNLWWLVAIFNDVVNPYESLEVGSYIRILKDMYLFMVYDALYEIERL